MRGWGVNNQRVWRANAAACIVAGIIATTGGLGCTSPPVQYSLKFPSENAFLLARLASVTVYEGEESPDEICRALTVDLAAGARSVESTGDQSVCSFYSGDATTAMDGLPAGRLVFFAKVTDKKGNALLRGCTVADVTPETDVIEIQLATLPNYPADAPSTILNPECVTVQSKCGATELDCDIRP